MKEINHKINGAIAFPNMVKIKSASTTISKKQKTFLNKIKIFIKIQKYQ